MSYINVLHIFLITRLGQDPSSSPRWAAMLTTGMHAACMDTQTSAVAGRGTASNGEGQLSSLNIHSRFPSWAYIQEVKTSLSIHAHRAASCK